jgi:Tol biopolymer transport system component
VRRALVSGLLVIAMFAFGIGVYQVAGHLKAGHPHVQRPTQTGGPVLPGTVYVVQGGAIYGYQKGRFSQLTSESGWMQPAADPSGSRLVAVRKQGDVSDLYLLARNGVISAQLTHNSSATAELNHWAFYPRFSADGSQLFYDYDPKDWYNPYRVDLSIFASPADPASTKAVQWTRPNQYTGGDVTPVPLRGGGLIYTKFSIDDKSKVHSQIWLQQRPGSVGAALTDPEADCIQPTLSADEHLLAMVCSSGQPLGGQISVTAFYPATASLGQPAVVARGQLLASPAFSPDGRTVAYLAPATPGGGFQLWTIPALESTAPAPKQITTNLDLDATSAPVWVEPAL